MPELSQLAEILGSPPVLALGYALLHFLWQGAVVAGLLWIVLKLLHRHAPEWRYGAACAALAAMFVLPVVTWVVLWPGPTEEPFAVPLEFALAELSPLSADLPAPPPHLKLPIEEPVPEPSLSATLRPLLPSLILAWGAGVLVLLLRLLGGWGYSRHMIARRGSLPPKVRRTSLKALALRMGVYQSVDLRVVPEAVGPYVVGCFRPVVFVPLEILTGLPAWQVEAILAHELAHIRRHDYLVNALQCMVEALLFYHPAVWWLSGQIRHEREHCCDDQAATACGDAGRWGEPSMHYLRGRLPVEPSRTRSPRVPELFPPMR